MVYTPSTKLAYPLERADRVRARISFQPYQVIPPDVDTSRFIDGAKDLVFGEQRPASQSSATEILESQDTFAKDRPEFVTQSNNTRRLAAERLSQKTLEDVEAIGAAANNLRVQPLANFVHIYTPIALQFQDGVEIATPNLNTGGAVTAQGIAGGGDVFGSLFSGIAGATSNIFDLIFKGGTLGDAGRVTASRLVDIIPGLNPAANAFRVGLQVTANPNQRAIFQGVRLRQFNLQFKFIPVSAAEAREVENIVRFFREEIYPEVIPLSDNSNIPYGYNFPNLFKLKMTYDVNGTGNFTQLPNMEVGLSYLSNIQHTYNSSSSVYHTDGKPTETDLILTFNEYRTLSKDDVKNGINDYNKQGAVTI